MRPKKLVGILERSIKYLQDPASNGGKYAKRYGLFEKLGKIVWTGRKSDHGASVHTPAASRYFTWLQPFDKKTWGGVYISEDI